MNTTGAAIASAVVFVWLGTVLAISFLEAPLKFRAPGVTIPLGLGIGRPVFRALNIAETVLAAAGAVTVGAGDHRAPSPCSRALWSPCSSCNWAPSAHGSTGGPTGSWPARTCPGRGGICTMWLWRR